MKTSMAVWAMDLVLTVVAFYLPACQAALHIPQEHSFQHHRNALDAGRSDDLRDIPAQDDRGLSLLEHMDLEAGVGERRDKDARDFQGTLRKRSLQIGKTAADVTVGDAAAAAAADDAVDGDAARPAVTTPVSVLDADFQHLASSADEEPIGHLTPDEVNSDLMNTLDASDDSSLLALSLDEQRARDRRHVDLGGLDAATDFEAFQESADADTEPVPRASHKQSLLALHPIVNHALDSMKDEVGGLKVEANTLKESQNRLEGITGQAEHMMVEGTKIRREIISREAELRAESIRSRALKGGEMRIQEHHDAFVSKLHAVLDPRMLTAQERFEESRRAVNETAEALSLWAKRRDDSRKSALELIATRRTKQEAMETAEEAAIKAEQLRDQTSRQFDMARRDAAEALEGYKYADAHYQAAKSREEESKDDAEKEASSLKRLRHVAEFEEKRIEESTVEDKQQLMERRLLLDAMHNKTLAALTEARQRYQVWQAASQQHAQTHAAEKANFDANAEKFKNDVTSVYHAAEAKAADSLTRQTRFQPDDWAWGKDIV